MQDVQVSIKFPIKHTCQEFVVLDDTISVLVLGCEDLIHTCLRECVNQLKEAFIL